MDKLVVLGSGGHATSCVDVIEDSSIFGIAGLVDNKNKNDFMGYPYLGGDEILETLRGKFEFAFIAVGQIRSADTRIKLYKKLLSLEFTIPTIFAKDSYVSKRSNVDIGSIVMHEAIVNANVKIGRNCILNTRSLIEHDSKIGDFCHISTGAIVNGNCNIGNESFIGSGSVIKEGVSIGTNCIVGANVFLSSDLSNNTKYIG